MRICNAVLHSCVRAHKQAWVAMKNGHDEILLSENLNQAHGWYQYQAGVKLFCDPYHPTQYPVWHFKSSVKAIDPIVDLYHVHNEPDWPVNVIRQVSDKPLIWDCHDMVSKRNRGVPDEWEIDAGRQSDAIIVPSRHYKEILEKQHPGKAIEEVLSCVPKYLFPKARRLVHHPGIVYEGGLGGLKSPDPYFEFPCRNWVDVFKKLSKMGIPIWAYRANTVIDVSIYADCGIMMMGPFDYISMLNNLTAHDAGLTGSPYPDPMFEGALPNKLFEYIAAGLPVINFNAPDIEEFLFATGLGVTVQSLEEIPDVLELFKKENYKERVWKFRDSWTMEGQWPKIERLYRHITENRGQPYIELENDPEAMQELRQKAEQELP